MRRIRARAAWPNSDDEGVITRFEEKPQQPRSNLANAGVYVVSGTAFREMADPVASISAATSSPDSWGA